MPVTYFGTGTLKQVPEKIRSYWKKALFITGRQSFISTNHWVVLQQKCEECGISIGHAVADVEPTPTLIDDITQKFIEWKPDVVVAIGGGSVVDAGKAVSAMLCLGGTIVEYLEGIGSKVPSGQKVPFIAVPTTSGTGAEATKNAVISQIGTAGFKRSIRHNNYVPDVAVIDPELTLSCPRDVTAQSGMDAFTQLLESYLSTNASPYTDALAVDGIRHVRNGLQIACLDGANLKARSDMAYAAYLSGITLANAGLGTVHGFASSIGGYFNIPHGQICACMMSPVNRITVRKLRNTDAGHWALYKYARIGKLFSQDKNRSDEFYTDLLLELIDRYTGEFGIKRLCQYGVQKDDFDRIVGQTGNKFNPVGLNPDELKEALELAF
ncbi:MAG: iron-containing alcohol dehydrogenase [Cyclobacteriaceae bacterium]|nr:iron-containing alcohol dehydrogenase [Cyclobacteriaceae bacterium]